MTFTDFFPPLCNRLCVQICDKDAVSDDVIATHFIQFAHIMDPGGEADNEDDDGQWFSFASCTSRIHSV